MKKIDSFDDWSIFLFDHDVGISYKEWTYIDKFLMPKIGECRICELIRLTFSNIKDISLKYNSHQIAYGLNYIINPFVSDSPYVLLSQNIEIEKRLEAINSMRIVFSEYFNYHCDNTSKPINYVCKMWWDIFPRHGEGRRDELTKKLDQSILLIFDDLLKLDNLKCVEAMLHGLGHWQSGYPEEVEKIINDNMHLIPESLHDYARQCKVGYVN